MSDVSSLPTASVRPIPVLIGLVFFLLMAIVPRPEGVAPEIWWVLAIAGLMLIWWVTEAIPLPVTGLVPVVLMPICGVLPLRGVVTNYAPPIMFLLLGGMTLALAMERTGLPRRIVFMLLRRTGSSASGVMLGFMLASGGLSMWMSNTGTTAAMTAIAFSVIAFMANPAGGGRGHAEPASLTGEQRRFAMALMMAIAFSANIGGTGTPIGTAPNLVFIGFMEEQIGLEIGFAEWMMVGIPFALVMVLCCWFVMTRLLFPNRGDIVPGAAKFIEDNYQSLGPMGEPERRALLLLLLVITLWITHRWFAIPGVTSHTVATMGAIACFLIPRGKGDSKPLLRWEDMRDFPWGVLIMFGGGLALAAAMVSSGLAALIGEGVMNYLPLPEIMIWVVLIALLIFMTELVSNTAILSAMLPILHAIAVGFGADPVLFALPMALAVSCAFMLPTATPPNAIVFASGYMRVKDMMRAGIWLNLVAAGIATLAGVTIIPLVFGG